MATVECGNAQLCGYHPALINIGANLYAMRARASVEENERDENDDMPEEDCSVRARS